MDDARLSDRGLVERIVGGDKPAFRIFIDRYSRLVSHIVYRLIDNTADREDLCQEIFVRAYKNLKQFEHRSRLSTWTGRIAFNTCANYLKKLKIPLFDDVTDDEGSIEEYYFVSDISGLRPEQIDISDHIESALSRLSPNYRTIVTLYHLDELSYAEIGEIMQLPEGTVKSYLFRARKALKSIIEERYKKEDLYR